jgi:starch synthase
MQGGGDMCLMPSRFEPCGLHQMYSLRYGTVPVVRAVGGLYDTVRDYDERTGEGNGFTFADYTPAALLGAIRRALAVFGEPAVWRRIQQTGMREDHSWEKSAQQYTAVYERAATANS